ncbi:HAD family hydrolase [Chloroflexota bacterium]
MTLTHVFFDLNGVLVDTGRLTSQYQTALGRFMAARYGGAADDWSDAYRRVVTDWDSYYADLDFSGEDSLDHLWEGQTRVLRALFRLTGCVYPTPEALRELVADYHYAVCSQCDALYPDAYVVLAALFENSLTLGIVSNAVQGHVRGLLRGANITEWFTGPIITPEVAGYVGVDAGYYRLALGLAGITPQQAVIVTADRQLISIVGQVQARGVLVDRTLAANQLHGDYPMLIDLSTLPILFA